MDIALAIYLRGEALVPAELTARLGFEPTYAQPCCDEDGVDMPLWAWDTGAFDEAVTMSEHVDALRARFAEAPHLLSLPGVQEAWIEFLILEPEALGDRASQFAFEPAELAALAAFGVPVQFTVGALSARRAVRERR